MDKSKFYVKRLKEYEHNEYDWEAIKRAQRLRKQRKLPTSVALEAETIRDLKKLAAVRGIPYQVLMRAFIIDGLYNSSLADGSGRLYGSRTRKTKSRPAK